MESCVSANSVCIHVCIVYIYIHILRVCVYVYIVYVYVCMYVCMCIDINIYKYIHIHLYAYVRCIYIHIQYVFIYTYIYIHTQIRVHNMHVVYRSWNRVCHAYQTPGCMSISCRLQMVWLRAILFEPSDTGAFCTIGCLRGKRHRCSPLNNETNQLVVNDFWAILK